MCPGSTYNNLGTSGTATQRIYGYFNTSAINCTAPAAPNSVAAFPGGPLPTLFGNSGPGIILGPGNFNWDISIVKTFHITERQTVMFRSEFFNTFKLPQFANPAVAIDSPATFGQITTTSVNPRLIQFALKYMF
jgi:hypothetical protein